MSMRRKRFPGLALVLALPLATGVACGSGGATGSASGGAVEAPRPAPGVVMAEIPATPAGGDSVSTTVIVVRHAEKAVGQGDDPHLSAAGEARARALARALEDAGVTAVITTQWIRTAETARPAARAAG
ncbi:MAG TPA: histidine phosphatase family protein, partial [Gemmatimonadaceae bacterium]|nr:histidine phosphatase family protein [Gemmatimonadaceae bacterium]